jgi:predicted lipoprotein with Yx(FWY)xxD motif
MVKSRFLAIGAVLITFLTAVNTGGFAPRIMSTTLTSSGQYVLTAAGSTPDPSAQTASQPTDWTLHGFSRIIASQQVPSGQAVNIQAGPYTIQVPAGAFSETVTLQVYAGDPSNWMSQVPSGETPVLAFALGVVNASGQLIGKFNKPVTLTATDPAILSGSKYYNVDGSGALAPNPTGLKVSTGELTHPIAADVVGWVITTPTSDLTNMSAAVTDWTQHGFPDIIASQKITPGKETLLNVGPYTLQIPGNAFSNPVTLQVYAGNPAKWKSKVPNGETPVLAFALGALDSQGQLIAKFNGKIELTAKDPAIVKGSKYYNVSSAGVLAANPTGMVVEPGVLVHPIGADGVGWLITSPTATLAPSSSSSSSSSTPAVTDWTLNGFPTILASKVLIPGDNNTVQAGPYTFDVPSGTFSQPVTFQVYVGSASSFKSQAPQGQQPLLAFAIGAMTSSGQLIGKFNKPIQLSVTDPAIGSNSQYDNISATGVFTPNPTGMQVSAGTLSHPIAADVVGWVITSPASTSASSTSASASSSQPATVMVANNAKLGDILVNSQGMTLYVFKNDKPNQSNCTSANGCSSLWPPLTVSQGATPQAGSGVPGTLGVIQRADGSYQVTYNQQPLYLYAGDSQAGQTSGNGLFGLWSVVKVSPSGSTSGSGSSVSPSSSGSSSGSSGY